MHNIDPISNYKKIKKNLLINKSLLLSSKNNNIMETLIILL